MPSPLIEMIDIRKRLGDIQVLNGINLSIHRGEITTVIGKSGTGKSVLLKHIIGLMQQDSGQLLVNGQPMDQLDKRTWQAFQKNISYMFQDNALFDSLTVYENVALPLAEQRKRVSRKEMDQKVGHQLSLLSLAGHDNKYPSELSGGMRKRVAMARALITEPQIVLFDEPTTGLDPIRKKNVHQMISFYQKQFGFTAVIVSHDIPEIFEISQHIAMLDTGRIVFEGTREDILNSRSELVSAFIRGEDIQAAQDRPANED